MTRTTGWQAGNFIAIGAIGFCVDGGLLTLLNGGYGVELVPARLVSFTAAVTVTWLLNRKRTFADRKDSRPAREWGRYAVVNGVGALLNMLIFFWLIARFEVMAGMPLLPLALAAGVALVFNFLGSRHVAFREQRT
jgi:putative flippase GtrA